MKTKEEITEKIKELHVLGLTKPLEAAHKLQALWWVLE